MKLVTTYPGSLHNHSDRSNFRLRDCICKLSKLVQYAKDLGHKVIAITDHETLANAIEIEELQDKNPDIQIIQGNEIYLCRNGLNQSNFKRGIDKYYHFVLLAKDLTGYYQLCELSTRAWKRSYMTGKMRRVPTYYSDLEEVVAANPGHLIASTACLGSYLGTSIISHGEYTEEVIEWINYLVNIFGKENFFFEMQPSASKEQTLVNNEILKLSKELDIPYIITTDTHYLSKKHRNIHKAYLNSQEGDREVDSFYATTYLMDTNELESHLDLTEEELSYAYNNILSIADKCERFSIKKPLNIPSLKWKEPQTKEVTPYWYNKIPMFHTFMQSDFNGDKLLCRAIIDGILAHDDLQNEQAYQEINSNLEATWTSSNVNKAHWSAYFLNLQNILDLCWDAGSLVGCGRGSGVGFILLYVLGITQINPLAEPTKTYAWRFLNPDRVSVLD